MPYLIEALLFALPFVGYAIWRRYYPAATPGRHVAPLALLGVACAMAGALWYGLSRNMPGSTRYVPPHYEDGRLVPGHAEPRR